MIIQKKLIKPIENKGAVKLGSVATTDHNLTTNRDLPNQHPQEAITGLTSDLNTIKTDISDNSSAVSLVKDEITALQVEIDAKPDKLFVETQLANKANKTEIDTIDAALEVHSTNISDNAANILLKANETELVNKQDKLTAGANIDITDNVISSTGGGGSGDVTLDTAQNITGIKTFTNGIKNNLVEVDGKSLIIKNSNTSASYLEVESVYSGSGYKNWFGMQFFRTTGASRSRLANVEIRQDDGLYIACANDVSIQGSNIKFNNVRLQQVGTPTADYDAATKKYADDGLALKQNKLTAGTGIDITGDVISASGGGSTPTNMMTTDTAQTITGIKTFENGIKGPVSINGVTTINGATQFNGAISVRDGMFILDPIDMNRKKIINLGTPTDNTDAATKKYVDDAVAASLRPYLIDLEKRYGKGK